MSQLAQYLRLLRKKRGLTQQQLAEELGLNRPVIGAYEESRAEPSVQNLRLIAGLFGVSVDDLVGNTENPANDNPAGNDLRILPVVVDASNRERVVLVPVKAAAGYLNGFGDIDFIGKLQTFDLPFPELSRERTYRMFQVKGDSMDPIPDGAYIICSYLENWKSVKPGTCYIFVTTSEGIVYKRAGELQQSGEFTLLSDNSFYKPITISSGDIREIWLAHGYVCFGLPGKSD